MPVAFAACAFSSGAAPLRLRPSSPHAFCSAPLRYAPLCPRHAPVSPARPKRRRIAALPTAAFDNNGRGRRPDDNRFRNQSADFLVTVARFLQSPSGQVVMWGGLVWLVLTGRIGFIFDSFLFLFSFVTVVPVLAVLGFRWWLSRQLVRGECPSCGASITAVKGKSFPCPSCGNTVYGESSGNFSVKDPTSATIDIDAKQIDD